MILLIGRYETRLHSVLTALFERLYDRPAVQLDGLQALPTEPVEALVLGRRQVFGDRTGRAGEEVLLDAIERCAPQRIFYVIPETHDPRRHARDETAWEPASSRTQLFLVELGRVRDLGLERAVRLARTALAASVGVPLGHGVIPLLPGDPDVVVRRAG